MKQMFENANGVMVPAGTALQEIYHVFHYGITDTVSELFSDEWDGITEPINKAPCLEPIDDDPIINTLLTAENL